MNPAPSIAVITVCRNALPALQLTTASVRAQHWKQLSHVVVDGNSSDGTPDWLRSQASEFEVALSEPDRGIYDAMNKAIALCPETDWMIFLNAGDRFADDNVLNRLAPLLASDADIVFGDVAIRSTASEPPRVIKASPRTRSAMPGCHQSMLVRAELMRRLRFDTAYRVGGDFEFFLRAKLAGSHVAIHDGIVAEVAPEGFSAANETILRRDYVRALARHHGLGRAGTWWLRRRCSRGVRRVLSWITTPSA